MDSLLEQTYQNFEICIADDNSPNPETRETIEEYKKKSDKIHVVYRKKNGMISEASNSGY